MPLLGLTEPVHFLHFLAFVFVLTVFLMIIVSAWRPNAHAPACAAPARIDMSPWPHAKAVSALIVLLTLGFYIALAQ